MRDFSRESFDDDSVLTEIYSIIKTITEIDLMGDYDMVNVNHIIMIEAINRGNIEVVKWMVENKRYVDDCPLFHAAKCGKLEILKCFGSIDCDKSYRYIWAVAVESGKIETIIWLKENGWEWNKDIAYYATCSNNLEILKWSFNQGLPISKKILVQSAAEHGSLEMLKYLVERECKVGLWSIVEAAKRGHLEVVKFLIPLLKPGYVDEGDVCAFAAQRNKYEVLKWLKENGWKWDYRVYEYAERFRYKDILQYCVDNNCPKHF